MRWLLVLVILFNTSVYGATFKHEELERWIESQLRNLIQVPKGSTLDIKVQPIDRRVNIQSCDMGSLEIVTPQKPIYRNKSSAFVAKNLVSGRCITLLILLF